MTFKLDSVVWVCPVAKHDAMEACMEAKHRAFLTSALDGGKCELLRSI
jgi:hypothetical protein